MMLIVYSGIYRRTWLRTQGGLHMIPCMNQKMRMCLRLWVYIFTSGKNFTLMFKSYILRRITEALSEHVVIKVYVDANHAGTIANRRSHYGIIIYANNAPII